MYIPEGDYLLVGTPGSTASTIYDPWVPWNGGYVKKKMFASTCSDSNKTIWRDWNDYYTSATSTNVVTATDVWTWWSEEWNRSHPYPRPQEETARRRAQLEHYQNQGVIIGASAEQRAQWQREEQERLRKYEEEQRKIAESKKRADELLKSHLTPQQREELEQHDQFHLLVGDRKYRIRRGRARNIQLVNEQGAVVKTLCAHPSEMIPDGDCLLAQKLMLEANEQEFLRIANHS